MSRRTPGFLPGGVCVRCRAKPAFVLSLRSKELLCLDCMLASIDSGELEEEVDEDSEEPEDEEG